MEKIFGPNWKTTLTGFAVAIWLAVQPIITKGDFELKRDWKVLVLAVLAAIFGLVTKDHNVTGGTTINDPNQAGVVDQATRVDKSVS